MELALNKTQTNAWDLAGSSHAVGVARPGSLVVDAFAVTHPGLERQNNEDAFCIEERSRPGEVEPVLLLCVADGLGGHRAGEVASQTAVTAMRKHFFGSNGSSLARVLEQGAQRANLEVYNSGRVSPQLFNMQTTFTAVTLAAQGLAVAHVGDCRLYRCRRRQLEVVTRDHTLAMDLLRLRLISPEQAIDHPGRYQLTRSLGTDPILRVDTHQDAIATGDTYLLCSDGLWSEVSAEEISDSLTGNPAAACRALVSLALERGGPDNITAIAFRVVSAPEPAPATGRWRTLLPWGRNGS